MDDYYPLTGEKALKTAKGVDRNQATPINSKSDKRHRKDKRADEMKNRGSGTDDYQELFDPANWHDSEYSDDDFSMDTELT